MENKKIIVNVEIDTNKKQLEVISEETIDNSWNEIEISLKLLGKNFKFNFTRETEMFGGKDFSKHPTTAAFILLCIISHLPNKEEVTVQRSKVELLAVQRFVHN